MNIDGVKEKVIGYGYSDDGKTITGHYVTTENYHLYYDREGNFKSKELRNINNQYSNPQLACSIGREV